MVSSASAQIETTAGDTIKTAEGLPDYGKVRFWFCSHTKSSAHQPASSRQVSAILIGVVAGWLIVCCLVGREDHGAHFEHGKAAFEKGGGLDESESRRSHASSTSSALTFAVSSQWTTAMLAFPRPVRMRRREARRIRRRPRSSSTRLRRGFRRDVMCAVA